MSPLFLTAVLAVSAAFGAEDNVRRLTDGLDPFMAVSSGEQARFSLQATIEVPIKGKTQRIDATLVRTDDASFDLQLTHSDYAVQLRRRGDVTAFALPKHRVVFMGRGETTKNDHLTPAGIATRLVGSGSTVASYLPLVNQSDSSTTAVLLTSLLKVQYDPATEQWAAGDTVSFRFGDEAKSINLTAGEVRVALSVAEPTELAAVDDWPGFKTVTLQRQELEQQLARGVRRALEIFAPSAVLTSPVQTGRKVAGGELRWVDGQRVVLLRGTPQQIGRAHGELLKAEVERCVDSVLNTFGTVQTIRTGRWFRHELEAAYARLAPHIPEDHKRETRAMGESAGMEARVAAMVNVFPELFHCSGFAVFGNATQDGKLYHGRVLDYMTTIGLQDSATTFIVAPDGKIPFANVGYAGFIGSVSGMNAQAISLGEMGGGGEGQWDGAPMATLMRRALEECSTLDEVMDLWKTSPRTCEYYYVFADGKTNRAVGVAALPESIEFVLPGQAHARLGEGIEDTVVLSSGSRLEKLRQRVTERHGTIDVPVAQWLMSRPVAMSSNLHNVLFVPEDGVLYVANADHRRPAAERPYTKLDLHSLLETLPAAEPAMEQEAAGFPLIGSGAFAAADSLNIAPDASAEARHCLEALAWQPDVFEVACELVEGPGCDVLVRFPSPVPSGNETNDRVTLEWYVARDARRQPVVAPAVVVVHESGRNMRVGRLIAWGLQQHGVHAFMINLPHYGARRGEQKPDKSTAITTIRQAIADVRRARDAVAALPHVDADRIALQGTSLGGFVSATSASLDGKYDSVFLMVAGGELYDLLQNGEHDTAKLRRQLEQEGVTDEVLRALTDLIEPTRVGHRLDPQRTWLYSGLFDRVVPIKNARALAGAIGLDAAHHVQLPVNHYMGVVYLPVVLQQIASHLKSDKNEPAP
ncbi:MAG: C45 family autoproteolytic acyltransferase/hydrolase [Candidatus Paceibacterota bacterium]